jgi:3-oxoadipate enol-lactonase
MMAQLDGLKVNYNMTGPDKAPTLVFAHSLGCDMSMFDAVTMRLPQGLRVVTYDLRGHGQTEVTEPPYTMGALVHDAEMLLDHLGLKKVVFIGVSIGGMIAQALAVKRLDLIKGLMLSNTAAKIGTRDTWQERIDAVTAGGLESIADGVMERWFGPDFIADGDHAPWRAKLVAMSAQGYVGCCAAIAGTDMITPTSSLRVPTTAIAGSEDRATPPDLVRETAELIPGSSFRLIRGAGHLPPIDRPSDFTGALLGFLSSIGHI